MPIKYTYKPSNLYVSLWNSNPDAKKAFELISKETSVAEMITVIEVCKKPALLALDRYFADPKYGLVKYKDDFSFKRMCGEQAKQVLAYHGYKPHDPSNIESLASFFKNASRYYK